MNKKCGRYKQTGLANYSVCNKIKYGLKAKLDGRKKWRVRWGKNPARGFGIHQSVGRRMCVVDRKSPRGSTVPVREDRYSPQVRGKRSTA